MTTMTMMTMMVGTGWIVGVRRQGAGVVRRVIVAVLAMMTMVIVAPGSAWALCPNCLGQTRRLTPTLELLGLFLVVPFVVAYVVMRKIRRACRDVSTLRGES